MPQTPHIERHFTSGEVVRDVVIGMSDGLTVPFALAATQFVDTVPPGNTAHPRTKRMGLVLLIEHRV